MKIDLYNDDCLKVLDELIEKGVSVDMVLCDPPFGITDCAWDKPLDWGAIWERLNKLVKPNGAVCLHSMHKFTISLANTNFKDFRYKWVWKKSVVTGYLNANVAPLRIHEDVLVFYKKKPTYNPQKTAGKPYTKLRKKDNPYDRTEVYRKKARIDCINTTGERYPTDIIEFNCVSQKAVHPTEKPVGLAEYFIKTYSNEGDTILDFCMGSGTTGVACAKNNRNFIGIEKELKYFNIAKERINEADTNNI